MSQKLVIQHDLSKLSPEQLTEYLRSVSSFIGLDPDLNALDTIWMQNENGPGQSLVVYARRGTAEILRNLQGIEISSLTQTITPQGSIVFTATGKNSKGRQEIAIGSKFIGSLTGKALDDAIMTASTRALRRVTMQFTSLGILDESEVSSIQGSTANPASAASLAGSSVVLPPMPVSVNNAPGKDVTEVKSDGRSNVPVPESEKTKLIGPSDDSKTQAQVAAVIAIRDAQAEVPPAPPKRATRKRNTVSMDGPEPEIVKAPTSPVIPIVNTPAPPAAPVVLTPPAPITPATPVPPEPTATTSVSDKPFPGMPTEAQMSDYRKRVSVYTRELPSSENMGSVQKMRAFITKISGTAPQFMTADQHEDMISWLESYVAKNQMAGLVKYINESLGVK